MTEIKIQLALDIGMTLFIEKEMIGGISHITRRFSKINNQDIKWYDVNEPSKFIVYLDETNLYGWAMSQYFCYSGFKCLD